jgi:NADH:ubiquinone oxidoreductase subunit 4 (subunit M)
VHWTASEARIALSALLLVVLAILLLWLGVYPTPMLDLIRTTVSGLN